VRWAAPALLALWAALFLGLAFRSAGEFGFPLDDAWIHARMARNLAEGFGLTFNPGEEGATSSAPLWSALLSLPVRARIPFPWAAYLPGLAATLALAWTGRGWLARATGDGQAATTAAILLVSTHPFPWAAVSGMEPSLAAALVLALLALSPSRGSVPRLLLAVAAALTRPELVLLPAVVLLDYLLKARPLRARVAAVVAVAAAAASFLPLLCNRALGGSWLAASFAAKVGHHGILAALAGGRTDQIAPILGSNLPSDLPRFLRAIASDNLALLLLAPFGLVRLARGADGTHAPWLLLVLQPCAMAVLAPFGGLDFHEQRYMAPLVATVVASGCAGLVGVTGGPSSALLRRGAALALLAISGVGTIRAAGRYGLEVRNITQMQVTVGRRLAARPERLKLVATNDIGAIGFITRAPILDLTGLATPGILPYLNRPAPPGRRNLGWNGANEMALLEYLEARRPDYVAIFPNWYPTIVLRAALGEPIDRIDLSDNLICGGRTMLVYRPVWEGATPSGAPAGRRARTERDASLACRRAPASNVRARRKAGAMSAAAL